MLRRLKDFRKPTMVDFLVDEPNCPSMSVSVLELEKTSLPFAWSSTLHPAGFVAGYEKEARVESSLMRTCTRILC